MLKIVLFVPCKPLRRTVPLLSGLSGLWREIGAPSFGMVAEMLRLDLEFEIIGRVIGSRVIHMVDVVSRGDVPAMSGLPNEPVKPNSTALEILSA